MSQVDRMIAQALSSEEDELLKTFGDEPGYFDQLRGVFGGRTGWVNAVMIAANTVAFVVAVWLAWHFFAARTPLEALRWGLPAAVLMVMSLQMKLAVWPSLQANRVIRELKLIELQLLRRDGAS